MESINNSFIAITLMGAAADLTLGVPGPNLEHSPMGTRPMVHF